MIFLLTSYQYHPVFHVVFTLWSANNTVKHGPGMRMYFPIEYMVIPLLLLMEEILHQLIGSLSYIPGGCLEFLPSTVR